MEVRTYLVKLGRVTQSGETCTPIIKEWFSDHPATVINCEVSGGYLRIQMVPFEGKFYPIKVYLHCDECEVCEPWVETVKPASDPSDCELCEVYDATKFICRDKCYPKKCDPNTGACVDCLPGDVGPCNQVCMNGSFGCPPNLPYKGTDNCCYECDPLRDYGECLECVGGFLQGKDCDGRPCIEEVGCVECTNDEHCTDPNECCQDDNTCDCCPGFERDTNGDCVKAKCKYDTDCYGCDECGRDGNCFTPECGPGLTLHPETCECVSIKCSGPCRNGRDCGPGCGCNKTTLLCEPCGLSSCSSGLTDCDNILGCYCNPSLACIDVDGPDDTCIPCTSWENLPAGYTCHEGCVVKCSNFSCDNTDCSSMGGCDCSNDLKCGDSGERGDGACKDTLNSYMDSCTLKTSFYSPEGSCNCSPVTFLVRPTLKNSSLPTTVIFDFKVDLRKGFATSGAVALTLPTLNDTTKPNIAKNEMPTTGEITLHVEYKVRPDIGNDFVVIDQNSYVPKTFGNIHEVIYSNLTVNKIGQSYGGGIIQQVIIIIEQTSDFIFPNGCVYDGGKLITKHILGYNGLIDGSQDPDNNTPNMETNPQQYYYAQAITSDMTRMPMFIYSRGETAENMIPYRKVYLKLNNKQRTEYLYGPRGIAIEVDNVNKLELNESLKEGGLWSSFYYSVKPDCSCAPAEVVQAIVCDDIDWQNLITTNDCNCVVSIANPPSICPINQDITLFQDVGQPFPTVNNAQTKYKITLYGAKNGGTVIVTKSWTFQHKSGVNRLVDPNNGNAAIDSLTYSLPDNVKINRVVVEMMVGNKSTVYCTQEVFPEESDDNGLLYNANCGSGDNYSLSINKNQNYPSGAKTIQSLSFETTESKTGENVVFVSELGNILNYSIPKGTELTITATFTDGCTAEETVINNCCDEVTMTITGMDSAECGTDLHLQRHVFGAAAILETFWTIPSGTVLPGEVGTGDLILANPEPGLYKVNIKDALECEKEASVSINSIQTAPTLLYTGLFTICSGQTTSITVNGGSLLAGATVYYSVEGSPGSMVLDNTGKYVIANIGTAATYNFNTVVRGNCTWMIDDTIEILINSTPTATLSLESNPLCLGSSTELIVTGTPGAKVTITPGIPELTIAQNGEVRYIITPTGSTLYRVIKIEKGTCISSGGSTVTANVNVGSTLSIVGTPSCNETFTEKTYTFNHSLTSAVDNNNVPIVPGPNPDQIVVNPLLVTGFTVYYDNGSCTSELYVPVESCECPEAVLELWTGFPLNKVQAGTPFNVYAKITSDFDMYNFYWVPGGNITNIVEDPVGSGIAISTVSLIAPSSSYSVTVDVFDSPNLNCHLAAGSINIQVVEYNPLEYTECIYCAPLNNDSSINAGTLDNVLLTTPGGVIDLDATGEFNFPYCSNGVGDCLGETNNIDQFVTDLATWNGGIGGLTITADWDDDESETACPRCVETGDVYALYFTVINEEITGITYKRNGYSGEYIGIQCSCEYKEIVIP